MIDCKTVDLNKALIPFKHSCRFRVTGAAAVGGVGGGWLDEALGRCPVAGARRDVGGLRATAIRDPVVVIFRESCNGRPRWAKISGDLPACRPQAPLRSDRPLEPCPPGSSTTSSPMKYLIPEFLYTLTTSFNMASRSTLRWVFYLVGVSGMDNK